MVSKTAIQYTTEAAYEKEKETSVTEPPLGQNKLGRRFYYDPKDFFCKIRLCTPKSGVHELSNLRFLRDLVPHARIAVDVGANIGAIAVELGTWAQQVHAFEPNPQVFELLKKNTQMAKTQRAEEFTGGWYTADRYATPAPMTCCADFVLHNVALGQSAEKREFDVMAKSGLSHIHAKADSISRPTQTIKVSIRALDSFRLPNVDILKIDVEGFEPSVLTGAIKTIRKSRPVIQMEVNSEWLARYGRSVAYIAQFFDPLGYFSTNNKALRIPLDHPDRTRGDRFFIPKEHRLCKEKQWR